MLMVGVMVMVPVMRTLTEVVFLDVSIFVMLGMRLMVAQTFCAFS